MNWEIRNRKISQFFKGRHVGCSVNTGFGRGMVPIDHPKIRPFLGIFLWPKLVMAWTSEPGRFLKRGEMKAEHFLGRVMLPWRFF